MSCEKQSRPIQPSCCPCVWAIVHRLRRHLSLNRQIERRRCSVNPPDAERYLRPYVGGDEILTTSALVSVDRGLAMTKPDGIALIRAQDRQGAGSTAQSSRHRHRKAPTRPTSSRAQRAGSEGHVSGHPSDVLGAPIVRSYGVSPTTRSRQRQRACVRRGTLDVWLGCLHGCTWRWVRSVAGRSKTDYRYSVTICYNTFPFPTVTDAQKEAIAGLRETRDRRAGAGTPRRHLPTCTTPTKCPTTCGRPIAGLDRAVDRCYRNKPFASDEERLQVLFEMYEDMTRSRGRLTMPDLATFEYAHTGRSTHVNAMGMREMQERAFDQRDAQYLLIKAPPASGKSRALMFIGLDKLENQGMKKVIVSVPERSIGSSFAPVKLSDHGFFADWNVQPEHNLCTPGVEQSKVQAFFDFMTWRCADSRLYPRHPPLRLRRSRRVQIRRRCPGHRRVPPRLRRGRQSPRGGAPRGDVEVQRPYCGNDGLVLPWGQRAGSPAGRRGEVPEAHIQLLRPAERV